MSSVCVEYRHRDNPLYESTSVTLKSRDSDHVISKRQSRCLLVLVIICIFLATAAVVMATVAITMLLSGASCKTNDFSAHGAFSVVQSLYRKMCSCSQFNFKFIINFYTAFGLFKSVDK